MVKNRAIKTAARKVKSATGIPYPRALAKVQNVSEFSLVLGTGTDGKPITWQCLPHPGNLSIQGPGGSGKTALLASLASQAAPHFDVYAYLHNASAVPAGLRACVSNSGRAWNLILDVRERMKSAFRQAVDYDEFPPPRPKSPDGTSASLVEEIRASLREDIQRLPIQIRPKPVILLVDDFDALCRNWDVHASGTPYVGDPVGVLGELARNGRRAGISLVIAGQAFARYRYASHGGGSNLLLGPATLAEREAFLGSDVARIEVGAGAGLYENGREGPVEVILDGNPLLRPQPGPARVQSGQPGKPAAINAT